MRNKMRKQIISCAAAISLLFSNLPYGSVIAVGETEPAEEYAISGIENPDTQSDADIQDNTENINDEEDSVAEPQNTAENAEEAEETEETEEVGTEETNGEVTASPEAAVPETTEEPEATAEPVNLDALLGSGVKYSELSEEEKAEAQKEYRIRDDVFIDCESAGMDFEKTTQIGAAIQTAEITAAEYLTMLTEYESEDEALEEVKVYGNFKYSAHSLRIEENPIYKNMLITGVRAAEILKCAVLQDILGGDCETYLNVDEEEIGTLLTNEQQESYYFAMSILSDAEPVSDADTEEYNDISKYPVAPFVYNKSESESFNESTGALGYNMNCLSLPGSNGMDINLTFNYDTAYSSPYEIMYTGGSSRPIYINHISPITNYAAGWSIKGISHINVMNIVRYRNDPVLETSDGRTFKLSRSYMNNKDVAEITDRYIFSGRTRI